jgi:hypothetical protein
MPVAFVKSETSSSVVDSCWPLYRVSASALPLEPSLDVPAQAVRANSADVATTAVIARILREMVNPFLSRRRPLVIAN